jgi:hypothetical protein
MNELTQEQIELFDKLTRLQQRVCLGVLGGLPQIAAYRTIYQCERNHEKS